MIPKSRFARDGAVLSELGTKPEVGHDQGNPDYSQGSDGKQLSADHQRGLGHVDDCSAG
jgi:hypothetical protein